MASQSEHDIVIVSSRWSLYMTGDRFDNREGGREHGRDFRMTDGGGADSFATRSLTAAEIASRFQEGVRRLLDAGVRVVLVYNVPAVGWAVPSHLAYAEFHGWSLSRPLSTRLDVYKERHDGAHAALDAIPPHPNLIRVRPASVFCDTDVPDRCMAELDGKPLYRDDDHLNAIGGRILVRRIMAKMRAHGWIEGKTADVGPG